MAKHRAVFSDALLPVIGEMLGENIGLVLDPFAGSGKGLRLAKEGRFIIGTELQTKWDPEFVPNGYCELYRGINALQLPFTAGYFDAAFTSPCYGNRMADHFIDGKGTADAQQNRNTYEHSYGEPLEPENAGLLQWGNTYRIFHLAAWTELRRVLKPGALFILNIKDHIRAGQRQCVTDWHVAVLANLGFQEMQRVDVNTSSNRRGQNGDSRIPYETVVKFIVLKE